MIIGAGFERMLIVSVFSVLQSEPGTVSRQRIVPVPAAPHVTEIVGLVAVPEMIVPPVTDHWKTFPGVALTEYMCDVPAATMPGRRVVGLP